MLTLTAIPAYPSAALAAGAPGTGLDPLLASALMAFLAFAMILAGFGAAIFGLRALLRRRGAAASRARLERAATLQAEPTAAPPVEAGRLLPQKTLLLPLPPQVLPLPTLLQDRPPSLHAERPSPDATVRMDASAIAALEITLPADAHAAVALRRSPDRTLKLPALAALSWPVTPARELVSLFAGDDEDPATRVEPTFDDGTPAVEIDIPRPPRVPAELRLVRSVPPPVPPALADSAPPVLPIYRRRLRPVEEQVTSESGVVRKADGREVPPDSDREPAPRYSYGARRS